jgi:hypothetical protein
MIAVATAVGSTRTPLAAMSPRRGVRPARTSATAWMCNAEMSGEMRKIASRKFSPASLRFVSGPTPLASRMITSYGATTPSASVRRSSGYRR